MIISGTCYSNTKPANRGAEEDPRELVIFTIARLICDERLRTTRLQVTVLFPAYTTQELFVNVAKLMEETQCKMCCYLCQRGNEKEVIPLAPKTPIWGQN